MARVTWRRRGDERKRIKNLALGVVSITYRKLAHGLRVAIQPFLVRQGIGVGVNQTQGLDESALAIGAAELFRLFDFGKPTSDVLRRNWWLPELMEISYGHTPVRHSATGIFSCHIAKCFFRGRVCERMQKGHRSLETFLYFARARRRKLETAELLRDRMLMFRDGGQRLPITPRQPDKANEQCEHRAHYQISRRHDSHHHASPVDDLIVNRQEQFCHRPL